MRRVSCASCSPLSSRETNRGTAGSAEAGCKVVEREPTEAMIEAGADAIDLFIGKGSEGGCDPARVAQLVLRAAFDAAPNWPGERK